MARRLQIIGTIAAFMLMVAGATFARASALEEYLFEGLLKLASQGDHEAEYHVGMMLNNGIGTAADRKQAFLWFEKSAEAGHPLGAYKFGCYYAGQFPEVVEIDNELALKYKLVAAQQGYDLAQFDVANHHYASGNYQDAIRWWTEAAGQGDPGSMYRLSAVYAQGKIVPTDLAISYRYLDGLRTMAEFRSDQSIADAFAMLTTMMTAAEIAAAQSSPKFIEAPTPLTLKARAGISDAKNYLAANMR